MKLKINYDLIEKIKESKSGIRLHKIFKERINNVVFALGISLPLYPLLSVKGQLISISWVFVHNGILGSVDYLLDKRKQYTLKQSANSDLLYLVNALSRLEVKTTTELLKDAEIIKTGYKLKFRDSDKLPVIKEEKYIEVPLCNGYKETLLQEHNIGSKDYELSVQEPVKKVQFKLAKATQ